MSRLADGPGLEKFIADSVEQDESGSQQGCHAGVSKIEVDMDYKGKLKAEQGERCAKLLF